MNEEVTQTVAGNTTPEPPAGAQNTVTAEHMIPKSRFDEINNELKAAKAKLSGYETERMSEAEKLQAAAKSAQEQAQAARQELQQARAEVAIARAAASLGVDPRKLARLVTVEFDADGQPVNVDQAAAAVLNEWPELKPVAATPGATNPPRTAKLTMADVKKMSPDEINSRWDEVKAAMAAGG